MGVEGVVTLGRGGRGACEPSGLEGRGAEQALDHGQRGEVTPGPWGGLVTPGLWEGG